MCFGIFQVNDVKAAPGIVKLTAGKTYTKYDVTGNGKKDKIIIRKEAGYNLQGTFHYFDTEVRPDGSKLQQELQTLYSLVMLRMQDNK